MQVQQQMNDGLTMAAITLGTAGVGSVFGGLANTARIANMGRLGTVLMAGGELATSAVIGGVTSAAMRSSDATPMTMANFKSGAIEGGLMTGATIGARGMGTSVSLSEAKEVVNLAKNGAKLTEKQAKIYASIKNTATERLLAGGCSPMTVNTVRGAYQSSNALAMSLGFNIASGIRQNQNNPEDDSTELDQGTVTLGAVTNLVGDWCGDLLARLTHTEVIKQTVQSAFSNFSSGILDAIGPAAQQQDAKVAESLGIKVALLGQMKDQHRNYFDILNEACLSGATSTLTAPLIAGVKTSAGSFYGRLATKKPQHIDRSQIIQSLADHLNEQKQEERVPIKPSANESTHPYGQPESQSVERQKLLPDRGQEALPALVLVPGRNGNTTILPWHFLFFFGLFLIKEGLGAEIVQAVSEHHVCTESRCIGLFCLIQTERGSSCHVRARRGGR
jgi:hypothetical protein